MINFMAMTKEELCGRLDTAYKTNRLLNRRSQLAEKERDRQLRLVAGMAQELKVVADRVGNHAYQMRTETKRLHREYCLASYPEATLKYRIVALDQEVLKLRNDANVLWERRVKAEDEVRRLQAENHELRMRIAELEGKQS